MNQGRSGRKETTGRGRRLKVGCASFVAVVLVAAVAAYLLARSMVDRYTSPTPAFVPKVEFTGEQQRALEGRINRFAEALEKGTPTAPLVLTADEVNLLIASDPEIGKIGGKAYVRLEGNALEADFSLPLDRVAPMGEGRYLNGTAKLNVRLANGRPVIEIDSIEANGRELPGKLADMIERNLPIEEIASDPDVAKVLGKLESAKVRDGQLVITPK